MKHGRIWAFSTILVLLLALCAFAQADVVLINDANFPNQTFREYVGQFDKDGNGLSDDEISAVTEIDVTEQNINDLKGIEFFTSLTVLKCSGNQLIMLDVGRNQELTTLWCKGNNLVQLNLQSNTNLTNLECSENDLETLNISANTELTYLSCFNNNLGSLSVESNSKLNQLLCHGNKITSLDVRNCQYLDELVRTTNPEINEIMTEVPDETIKLCEFGETNLIIDINTAVITSEGTFKYQAGDPNPESPNPESPNPESPAPESPAPDAPGSGNPAQQVPAPEVPGSENPAQQVPAPEVPDPVVICSVPFEDVHYSFGNTKEDLDANIFDIPFPIYDLVLPYGLATLTYNVFHVAENLPTPGAYFSGWCFGMAASSAHLNSKLNISGPWLSSYSANKVSELKIHSTNNLTKLTTVKELIEAFHVLQCHYAMLAQKYQTIGKLDSLVETVKEGINNHCLTVIGYEGAGKHALLGYKIAETGNTLLLYVYDCNCPNDSDRTIEISKGADGKYTKWHYQTSKGKDIGTDFVGEFFFYPESLIESIWNNRFNGLFRSKSEDSKKLTSVKGSNWKMVSSGRVLAEMSNGQFSGIDSSVLRYTGDDVASDTSLFYSNYGDFSIINTGSGGTLETNAASAHQCTFVNTTSGVVAFNLDDASAKNTVTLESKPGDTFDVTFKSDLSAASGKSDMKISGKSEGSEVVIGLSGSDVVVNNCTDVSVSLNGTQVQNLEDLGKNINFYDIRLEFTEAAYNGSAIQPGIIFIGQDLKQGTDYTVTYENNVGSPSEFTPAAAIIQGTGAYSGVKTLMFTIVPEGKAIKSAKISEIKDQTYTGKAITPKFTVTYQGAKLVPDTDYTVAWKNNKKIGAATLTVTGKGMFTGSKAVTFKIVPKGVKLSSLKAGSKQLTVKWKKGGKDIDGYEIEYCLKKNFKGAKTVTISKAKTTDTEIKKLKAKKKYYVRIRTFKKVKGKKYYSEWSGVKSATTKK